MATNYLVGFGNYTIFRRIGCWSSFGGVAGIQALYCWSSHWDWNSEFSEGIAVMPLRRMGMSRSKVLCMDKVQL
jgi:hypothetical protein